MPVVRGMGRDVTVTPSNAAANVNICTSERTHLIESFSWTLSPLCVSKLCALDKETGHTDTIGLDDAAWCHAMRLMPLSQCR